MPLITLNKPVIVDGVTWDKIDFDPSIDALEAFEKSVENGEAETTAIKAMLAFDGDIPIVVAGKLRMSDLMRFKDAMAAPFGAGSTTSVAGEPAPLK